MSGRWLPLVVAALLAGPSFAQEAAPDPVPRATFSDGCFHHPYWDVTFAAEGLERQPSTGGPDQLFEGRLADGLRVELLVHEDGSERTGVSWRKWFRATWTGAGRVLEEVVESGESVPHLVFTEERLMGPADRHGWVFHARGMQVFLLHVYGPAADFPADRVEAALGGVELGPDAGKTVLALDVARAEGRSPDDPGVLYRAGRFYSVDRHRNDALARIAFEAALANGAADALSPAERFDLEALLAAACHRLGDFERSAELYVGLEQELAGADPESRRRASAAYNLACSLARAGRSDEAFAALERSRAVDGGRVLHTDGPADTDLESLHGDPRWAGLFAKEGEDQPE